MADTASRFRPAGRAHPDGIVRNGGALSSGRLPSMWRCGDQGTVVPGVTSAGPRLPLDALPAVLLQWPVHLRAIECSGMHDTLTNVPRTGPAGIRGSSRPATWFAAAGVSSRRADQPDVPMDQGQTAAVRRERRLSVEARRFPPTRPGAADDQPHDYLVLGPRDAHEPEAVFERLRWGAAVLFASARASQVRELAARYAADPAFALDRPPTMVRGPRFGLPWLGRRACYFVARRLSLVRPGGFSDRFTFDVQLVSAPRAGGYIVLKQVPAYGHVVQRLRRRFPDASPKEVGDRARKMVDRVFPVFLTREAGSLQLLQRDLPESYRRRVPRLLGVRRGRDGLVQRLYMNWLRVDGTPMSQLTFAIQSADLLRVLHDVAGIMHLDLRLDNYVITPDGVGFVDFGSAVRIGEDLEESPLLRSLFDEMMSTSQIQRTLGRMKEKGRLTSDAILAAHGKVDRAVDVFYLALQMRRPDLSPVFRHLVRFDHQTEEARRIRRLTDALLRPKDPRRPRLISARDLLHGLRRMGEGTEARRH